MRALVAIAACAAVTACGGSSVAPGTDKESVSQLLFTRADGSTFTVSEFHVECGEDSLQGGKTAVRVTSLPDKHGPLVRFEAILDDVADGATFTLPYEDAALYEHPTGAQLFVADRATENEASSTTEDADGRLRIESAACEPEPSVRFTVDGHLGSEYGSGDPVGVKGTVTLGQ